MSQETFAQPVGDIDAGMLPPAVADVLFNSLPDALILVNRDLRVFKLNLSAERLLLVGADIKLLPTALHEIFPEALARACSEACVSTGASVLTPTPVDGATNWLEVTGQEIDGVFLVRVRDVTELRAAEDALRRRDERVRKLVKATNDIIWWADPANGFIEPQEAWEEFTGQTFDEYKHWGHVQAIHPDDRDRVQAAWAEATAERRPCRCGYRVYCPAKGEYRHCMANGVPVLDEEGNIREWVGTVTDIHDLKQTQEALAELNRALEERVQERTAALQATVRELENFTYTTSHDLRTALRGIVFNAHEILEECHDLGEERRANLQRLMASANRLSAMVDGLLQLSRISRNAVNREERDLSLLADLIGSSLIGPNHKLVVEPGLVCRVDDQMIRTLLHNLIENAVRYSPDGGTITVGRAGDAFFVRDEGIGFEMQYSEKIFMPFERLHRDVDYPGVGIGLATAQRVVNRHGGRLWVESAPGKGSTFYFTLEMEPAAV